MLICISILNFNEIFRHFIKIVRKQFQISMSLIKKGGDWYIVKVKWKIEADFFMSFKSSAII